MNYALKSFYFCITSQDKNTGMIKHIKFAPVLKQRAMKTYGGAVSRLHSFLTSALESSASYFGLFTPEERSLCAQLCWKWWRKNKFFSEWNHDPIACSFLPLTSHHLHLTATTDRSLIQLSLSGMHANSLL
jgi:hypothetical protein